MVLSLEGARARALVSMLDAGRTLLLVDGCLLLSGQLSSQVRLPCTRKADFFSVQFSHGCQDSMILPPACKIILYSMRTYHLATVTGQ